MEQIEKQQPSELSVSRETLQQMVIVFGRQSYTERQLKDAAYLIFGSVGGFTTGRSYNHDKQIHEIHYEYNFRVIPVRNMLRATLVYDKKRVFWLVECFGDNHSSGTRIIMSVPLQLQDGSVSVLALKETLEITRDICLRYLGVL